MKNSFSNRNRLVKQHDEASIEQQPVGRQSTLLTMFSFLYLFVCSVLLNAQVKIVENQNDDIRHEIHRCYADLNKYDDKLQTLDNMTQLATQSLEVYFQKVCR
jgi:hypothetical protein